MWQRQKIQEVLRQIMSTVRTFNVEAGLPALDEARRLVIELTAILRVADSFDRSHHGLVRDLRLLRRNGRLQIELDTAGRDAALELWGAERKADLWEKCFEVDLEFTVKRPTTREARP